MLRRRSGRGLNHMFVVGWLGCRQFFGCDGAVGIGVVGGGIVEQGYASLLYLALSAGRIRGLLSGLLE
jgi:hypothetical protein